MVLWLLTMYTLEVLMNQVNPNRSVRKEGGLGGTLPELVLQDVDGLIQNVCDRLRQ